MFNRSAILSKAWADYRWGAVRGAAFNRKHFAYCLRMAWTLAKEDAARARVAKAPASVKVSADTVRAEAIRTELRDMELASDFINWTHRAALGAELVQLQN